MPIGLGETRVILEKRAIVPRFSPMLSAATYDHATAVADILAGYHRTEMALRRGDRAVYLYDKSAEAEQADRGAGDDPPRLS